MYIFIENNFKLDHQLFYFIYINYDELNSFFNKLIFYEKKRYHKFYLKKIKMTFYESAVQIRKIQMMGQKSSY